MSVPSSDTYTFDSSIRGYHVYRDRLVAAVGKTLICRKECGNIHDVYAVAVVEGVVIIGHMPRAILAVCYLFIEKGGTISCEITGSHRYSSDLPQGGLELPCKLTFSRPAKVMEKVRNRLKNAPRFRSKPEDQSTKCVSTQSSSTVVDTTEGLPTVVKKNNLLCVQVLWMLLQAVCRLVCWSHQKVCRLKMKL